MGTTKGRRERGTYILLDAAKLRAALAMRAMTAADLAAEAGISEDTVTSVLCGVCRSRVITRTAMRIAAAINAHPVVPGLSELLATA